LSWSEFDKTSEVAGSLLGEILRKLDKTGKKLLIAIDEAQVLAAKKHSSFVHALRVALDTRKDTVKVIFTGSSETTLRRVFALSSEQFQPLGSEFVEAMLQKVNKLSKSELGVPFALKAFVGLHQTPDFFRRFLNRFLTNAQLGTQVALDVTKQEAFDDKAFGHLWRTLMPADREVLRHKWGVYECPRVHCTQD